MSAHTEETLRLGSDFGAIMKVGCTQEEGSPPHMVGVADLSWLVLAPARYRQKPITAPTVTPPERIGPLYCPFRDFKFASRGCDGRPAVARIAVRAVDVERHHGSGFPATRINHLKNDSSRKGLNVNLANLLRRRVGRDIFSPLLLFPFAV